MVCGMDCKRCARHKPKRAILTSEVIRRLIADAKDDPEHGVYYVVPFLAGTRPFEQLGLLWSEVDFDSNVIRIRRIQERDGSLTEMTKTEPTRDIPMSPTLRELLLAWRVRFPRKGRGAASRVSRPRPATGMAKATSRRRWCLALPELPQALLATGLQAPQATLCDAAFRPAFVHFDAASGGHRGGLGGADRRPCQSDCDARPLHPGG